MRTIVAPLTVEVRAELDALDPRRAEIARRYIRRLRLQPDLGAPIKRGPLSRLGGRRVYFDVDDKPDDLFGNRPGPRRRGDQDLDQGPKWRIVYAARAAPRTGVLLIVVLAVGQAHPPGPQPTVYELAAQRLERRMR